MCKDIATIIVSLPLQSARTHHYPVEYSNQYSAPGRCSVHSPSLKQAGLRHIPRRQPPRTAFVSPLLSVRRASSPHPPGAKKESAQAMQTLSSSLRKIYQTLLPQTLFPNSAKRVVIHPRFERTMYFIMIAPPLSVLLSTVARPRF
jgi:hypothetical protein